MQSIKKQRNKALNFKKKFFEKDKQDTQIYMIWGRCVDYSFYLNPVKEKEKLCSLTQNKFWIQTPTLLKFLKYMSIA